MKITLIIRPGDMPGNVTMRTDLKHENHDSPRISNFGLEIKKELDTIIKRCADNGEVHT